jgi:diamine N-acetyltransferase
MPVVNLRPVDADSFYPVIKLKTRPEQKGFVADNVFSIAEAKVHSTFVPLAIYADQTLVGFTMYGFDPDVQERSIIRLMIDQAFQGQGYGRAATGEVIRRIRKEFPDCHELFLSLEPENKSAEGLYTSLGFQHTGRVEDGELVMRLALEQNLA